MKWWPYVLAVFGFFAYLTLRVGLEAYGNSIGVSHVPWLFGFAGFVYGLQGPAMIDS